MRRPSRDPELGSSVAVPTLTKAFAATAISDLSIDLEGASMTSLQTTVNIGFCLNTLLCRSSVRLTDQNDNQLVHDIGPVSFGKLDLWGFGICDRMFAAMCSAAAELSAEAHLDNMDMHLEGSGRWSWLIYAVCCGGSEVEIPSVEVCWGTLTRFDIRAITAVLHTNYPQPILGTSQNGRHQFGFVDILEGAELRLREVNGGDECVVVVSKACRCRALYDPTEGELVNVIVPGYGACKAKLGASSRFTPDCRKSNFPRKRLTGSFAIRNTTIESPAVLMDLLALVTSGLRSLLLRARTPTQLDLSLLCIACPDLQELFTRNFNVKVAVQDESLGRWPIKRIDFMDCTGTLADLTSCLRNKSLRLARELVHLQVRPPRRLTYDDAAASELMAHDGEILPVTKDKLPAQSKAAMISVVTSTCEALRPIHRLDAYILSLVFVFASTPGQRAVICS